MMIGHRGGGIVLNGGVRFGGIDPVTFAAAAGGELSNRADGNGPVPGTFWNPASLKITADLRCRDRIVCD